MRLGLLSLVLIGASSCSLGFNYQQCTTNDECAQFEGQPYCTEDGLCVPDPIPRDLCAVRYPAEPPPSAVPIGAMLDLTPDSLDASRFLALQLGLDEVNDQSRFNKNIRPLSLTVCDTGKARAGDLRQKDLENMVTYLANTSKAVGIVGPTTNADARAVLTVSLNLQVPIVSPSADAAVVGDQQSQGYFFRTSTPNNLQAQKLAQSAADIPNNNPPTASVFLTLASEQSDYGESLRQTFQDKWDDRNQANVPSATPTFPPALEAKDKVTTVGNGILTQDPAPTHLVVLISREARPHAMTLLDLVKDLKTFNVAGKATQVWLSDGALGPDLVPLGLTMGYEKLIANMQGVAPLSLDKGTAGTRLTQSAAEFVANMKTQKMITIAPETGGYDIYIGYTYDAFYALAMAVESIRGMEPSGPQVSGALRRIKSNVAMKQYAIGPGSFGSFVIGVSTLQSGGEVGLSGVSGALRFTAQGDREPALYERWKVEKIPGTTMPMTPATAQITFKPF